MGMQGIGKTTLANLIFNHKAVVDHFPFAAWRSDGYRFQLNNKGELLQSGRSQCSVWSNQYEMQRLIPFLINDRSLIVVDNWNFLVDDLEMLPDALNEDLVQPEGENKTPKDVAERCLNLLIGQGMVQVTKKKLNGNVKMVRLPDALRQYWSSKAQQATFLGVHTNTISDLSLGTNKIRRLVDHLDKEDISFDHIHGNHNTTSSTSLTPYYEDVLSFLSFDTREEVGNFLRQSISSGCLIPCTARA
ncbi:hypothetical protein VitviT2T_007501 [Vitis vinifera]|uniref:NB-ARC domain-containing protein n=1 Tax=Vitis vinifera TaxID=29760 RepID=A0ABY9BYX3_VITVI|nr:hypothetical protein VitviT2T_007501 [Vitis vinifera]